MGNNDAKTNQDKDVLLPYESLPVDLFTRDA